MVVSPPTDSRRDIGIVVTGDITVELVAASVTWTIERDLVVFLDQPDLRYICCCLPRIFFVSKQFGDGIRPTHYFFHICTFKYEFIT